MKASWWLSTAIVLGSGGSSAVRAQTPVAVAATPTTERASADINEAKQLVEEGNNTAAVLQQAITLYERSLGDAQLPTATRVLGYTDLARAYLRAGDVDDSEGRFALYQRGRAAAAKAIALNPKHADAYFWDAANLASHGREKGVMNSLFTLSELRKTLNKALQLDPGHLYARRTLGEIDHAVPGIAGGSDARAEAAYLEVLKRDPHFTPAMITLARLYRDNGDVAAAKRWVAAVMSETAPTLPADHRKFDVPDAKKLRAELGN